MKIYNNKLIKTGINKNGKPYTLVGLSDSPEGGRSMTCFEGVLADIVEGTDVDGTVTENTREGKTFYTFKMAKRDHTQTPYPLKDAPAKPTEASKPVSQDVWDKKDKMMYRMSALKAASSLYEGVGGDKREEMLNYAEDCIKWLTGESKTIKQSEEEQPPMPPPPDEIDTSDIPF